MIGEVGWSRWRSLAALLVFGLVVARPEAGLGKQINITGVDVTVELESAMGEVPGHWGLNKKGFRSEFLPDSGFGNGVYSVPLEAPAAIAFDLDSARCVPCKRIAGREHRLGTDPRPRNAYECRSLGSQRREAFFLASDEFPALGIDPGWIQTGKATPRFPMATSSKGPVQFHEWVTTKEVLPGKRLACGAWFEGAYPPEKGYNEARGDTTDITAYTLHDRAIYLLGAKGRPEYLLRNSEPIEDWNSTFESAFLPADHSELARVRFTYVYPIRGGFLLRVDVARDFEGAGAEEAMLILRFRNGVCQLLAGASETRMY